MESGASRLCVVRIGGSRWGGGVVRCSSVAVAVALLDVQRSVESVARALREREDELVSVILERTVAEVPEAGIQEDPDMAAAMSESAYANLRAALAELARDRSPAPRPACRSMRFCRPTGLGTPSRGTR